MLAPVRNADVGRLQDAEMTIHVPIHGRDWNYTTKVEFVSSTVEMSTCRIWAKVPNTLNGKNWVLRDGMQAVRRHQVGSRVDTLVWLGFGLSFLLISIIEEVVQHDHDGGQSSQQRDATAEAALSSGLVATRHKYHGRVYWVIKEPVGLNYFRFHEEEYAILRMLDGKKQSE